MPDVVIVSAVRTPIGRLRGALSPVRPDDLGALVLKAAVERAGIDPAIVEEVYFGCANQAGEDNRNIARMSLLLAGFPDHVAGLTLNRLCASGLSAINQAARAITAGEGDVYIAGGVESMSRAPYALAKNSMAFGPTGNSTAFDTSLGWRFPNKNMAQRFPLEAMGETAENIVERSITGEIAGGAITRGEQDRFALQSQERALNAIKAGYFDREIVPVSIPQRRGDDVVMDTDEHPQIVKGKAGYQLTTSAEKLATLKPAFRPGGTVTAGNSSGMNDGAAALVLMSGDKAKTLSLKPLARWVGSAVSGVDPRIMGMGPVAAVEKLLKRNQLRVNDLDMVELNEAFAAQALGVMHELKLSESITNVNGGAIALGHPLGSSGARIVCSMIHEMQRRSIEGKSLRYGLATLCVGVGQGEAALFELLEA